MNDTNWKRHQTACNVSKLKSSKTVTSLLSYMTKKRTINDEDEVRLSLPKDTLKDKITTATSNYGSPVTPLNKLNTGNANTIVAPIDLVTNSIASYISNIVEQDVRHFQFPNDPSIVLDSKMSPEQFAYVAALQPCQPKASELKGCIFPTRMQGKWLRSFHEEHYYKKLPNGEFVKRTWISYSPSQDKVYCIVCKQFGKEDAKSHQLARFGSDDWSHISFKLKSHESNSVHLESEIRRAMFVSNQRVVSTIFESSNRNVAENREIVRVIFESLIYLARQNIAFRGRDESWTSNNQCNFIELIKFISKYNPTLSSHLTKIQNSKKKNRLTFLSNLSQNNMLHVLGEMVRERILIKIKKSGVFSFIIDTTTDVSNIEQLSLVIRFINENEEVEERLVALETVSDARGIGMFNVLCNICQKYDIDWEKQLCAQSYDGASSMQGQYSGVRAYIQEKNPRAIYVWCFSHILNLVVVDTCDTSKTMRNFFGDLQSLIAFLRARKRTAVFLNHQKICYPEKRVCRMKNFSTTRWTSHGRALTVIFEKYKALTNTLKELSNSTERDTSSVATNLLSTISSFQFVTHLLLMKNIFKHTTPLSMYLQSLSLDFITALTMVDNCAKKLSELRNEQQLDVLLAEAKTFSLENELEEVWFPEKRVQRRKKMAGEKTNDEIVSNAKDNFKIQVYFTVLDQICTSITSRFEGSREILSDLSLLSVDRLIAASKGCPIPEDNFVYLDKWIPNVQIDQLKLEYSTFAYSFLKLKSNIEIEKLHEKVIISESDEDTSVDTDEGNSEENKTKMTVLNVLKLLNTFNLISAFPNMYMAYKFLCTIPATSVSSERTFSKLKLIKTRIRSTMVQKRLDSLMLLSCEKDVIINLDEAINKYANTSKLLQEALLYK
ncbi:unnamed protein product [Macrosiphum euphorbiae]|uniref:Zinc finger MYM-type protein 1-like n=1 Tax=Macrosiphum euphorbiae TaxID=13131 RepID=A0AAV0VXU0_9HEMI|nr:unnamed protein product [Macrosiphum euphorbiae]